MDTDPRCPDCGVTMERVNVHTSDGFGLTLDSGEKRDGFLGSLGVTESKDLSARACPECGLVRFYAEE
ncbi:hypothetical protein [Halorussus halobius]|uniref:hypothetical protein n=1 Tax=Halorussus halobius TaxID=1710537 RepID=UPI0010931CFB|nr:hypothetical protein [Halorussus halobius]